MTRSASSFPGSAAVPLTFGHVPMAALHLDDCASIYLHSGLHIGVRFPTPHDAGNAHCRMVLLQRSAEALQDLGAVVGEKFEGSDRLVFPDWPK
jgi:hypothetical protein